MCLLPKHVSFGTCTGHRSQAGSLGPIARPGLSAMIGMPQKEENHRTRAARQCCYRTRSTRTGSGSHYGVSLTIESSTLDGKSRLQSVKPLTWTSRRTLRIRSRSAPKARTERKQAGTFWSATCLGSTPYRTWQPWRIGCTPHATGVWG